MPIKQGEIPWLRSPNITGAPAIELEGTDGDVEKRDHHEHDERKKEDNPPKAFRPAQKPHTFLL